MQWTVGLFARNCEMALVPMKSIYRGLNVCECGHLEPPSLSPPLSHTLIPHTAHNSTSYQRCVVSVDRWRRRLEWRCSCQSGWQTAGAGRPRRAGLSKVLADQRRLWGRRGWLHVRRRWWRLQRLILNTISPENFTNVLSWTLRYDPNACPVVPCVCLILDVTELIDQGSGWITDSCMSSYSICSISCKSLLIWRYIVQTPSKYDTLYFFLMRVYHKVV